MNPSRLLYIGLLAASGLSGQLVRQASALLHRRGYPKAPIFPVALLALALGAIALASALPPRADGGPNNPIANAGTGATFAADDRYPHIDLQAQQQGFGTPVLSLVVGTDDRVQVSDTDEFPFSAIAWLGLYSESGVPVGNCTGTFIGPDVVLTAGHCLYSQDFGGWVGEVDVIPGRDSDVYPYGIAFAENWWVPDTWVLGADNALYDWGIIKMPDSTMGKAVGWFTVASLTTETLERSDFTPAIIGYPGDKPLGTMWGDLTDAFLLVDTDFLWYDIDLWSGQSGSAIFSRNVDEWFQLYVVGIHTSSFPDYAVSGGSRIHAELLDDILLGCSEMGCSISHFTEPIATPTPAVTPKPSQLWGDADCDGDVDAVDALKGLRYVAALSVAQNESCPIVGTTVEVGGASPHLWGDVDCDNDVDAVDSLKLLRHVAALFVTQTESCPGIGSAVTVTT